MVRFEPSVGLVATQGDAGETLEKSSVILYVYTPIVASEQSSKGTFVF
jgi:hypothetical protein